MFASIDQLTTVISGAPMPFLQKTEPVHANLCFHLVLRFDVAGFDDRRHEEQLSKYIAGYVRRSGGRAHLVGFAKDRVHVLFTLSQFCAIGTFVRELKLFAATFARRKAGAANFRWHEKYDAFTVSVSQIERVSSYIRRQKLLERQESYASSWNRLASQEI